MIGTKSNPINNDDLFFSQEKEKKVKKLLQVKFVALIILSNIFTALLISPTKGRPKVKKPTSFKQEENNSKLLLELSVSIPLSKHDKTPVELFSRNGKLLTSHAYIHKRIDSPNSIHGHEKFVVEVPSQDIYKFVGLSEQTIIAIAPHLKREKQIKKPYTVVKKEENYEIKF